MFGFIQIPLLSLNPCFLWPLNPFLLQTVSEKNPTSTIMCHNQKAEVSCSAGQILVTLVALLLMSKHNYSGFVLRMQLYLWLLEEHLFFLLLPYYVHIRKQNYNISYLTWLFHTSYSQNSRGEGHFILAKSSPWITDFRISGLRLYRLRLIKIARINCFRTQRRAVKRMMREG